MVAASWNGSLTITFTLGLIQFLLAPYSFFVSFARAVEMSVPILIPHFLVFSSMNWLYSLVERNISTFPFLSSVFSWGHLPINGQTIIIFFLVDQATCLYATCFYPDIKQYTANKIIHHVLYGFLNTKTMHLIILFHCWNQKQHLSIWQWLLDGVILNATVKIGSLFQKNLFRNMSAMFYHQHRMAHLPIVYQHAHKLHHHLQGATAFDAGVWGCGMPEEFFFLFCDLFYCTWTGIIPTCFNKLMLSISFRSKFQYIVRVGEDAENFHSDHHTLHSKNFGVGRSFGLLDLYFTTYSSCRDPCQDHLYIHDKDGRVLVEKIVVKDQNSVQFVFKRE